MAETAVKQQEVQMPTPGTWTLDRAHTSISGVARHMVVTKVRGHFAEFEGSIHVGGRPEDSWVEVTIQADSIDTGNATRDAHLRSADFLDVENNPTITFRSTGTEVRGDRDLVVAGDLTIRGVTRPVRLEPEFLGLSKDPWGKEIMAFSARTEIDREEFGMTWNQALEAGGVLVSRKIQVEIDVEAVRAD